MIKACDVAQKSITLIFEGLMCVLAFNHQTQTGCDWVLDQNMFWHCQTLSVPQTSVTYFLKL